VVRELISKRLMDAQVITTTYMQNHNEQFLCITTTYFKQLQYNAQIILWTNSFILSSLLPQSPPWWKECLLFTNPCFGEANLNAQTNELATLKFGPTVSSSWIKSSTQIIPYLPKDCSTIWFEVIGILYLLTLP